MYVKAMSALVTVLWEFFFFFFLVERNEGYLYDSGQVCKAI